MPGRSTLVAGALLAVLLLIAPDSRAASAGSERLLQFIERVQTMRAAFRQVVTSAGEEAGAEAGGRFLLKRPGRFRWDYQRPYERVVLADGTHLWLYEADLDQVTVRPLAAGLGETPAALLTGGRDVLERFEEIAAWSGDELDWVRLKPRSADSDFESVAIAFAGNRPAQLEIVDRLGQQTRIYLTDVTLNPALTDDAFHFEVPEGADVIREGEL